MMIFIATATADSLGPTDPLDPLGPMVPLGPPLLLLHIPGILLSFVHADFFFVWGHQAHSYTSGPHRIVNPSGPHGRIPDDPRVGRPIGQRAFCTERTAKKNSALLLDSPHAQAYLVEPLFKILGRR